jgi:hypothetical protein
MKEQIIAKLNAVTDPHRRDRTIGDIAYSFAGLHVDYIPTMRGSKFRHPRHLRWVMDHIQDFRILCANHHYELTLTGQIEGTDITQ